MIKPDPDTLSMLPFFVMFGVERLTLNVTSPCKNVCGASTVKKFVCLVIGHQYYDQKTFSLSQGEGQRWTGRGLHSPLLLPRVKLLAHDGS